MVLLDLNKICLYINTYILKYIVKVMILKINIYKFNFYFIKNINVKKNCIPRFFVAPLILFYVELPNCIP